MFECPVYARHVSELFLAKITHQRTEIWSTMLTEQQPSFEKVAQLLILMYMCVIEAFEVGIKANLLVQP